MGTQISWLLPAALVALGGARLADVARRRAPISCGPAPIVWGGWLLVTGLVLSFASGIIHPYYTVALAPAIAALVGHRRGHRCGGRRRGSVQLASSQPVPCGRSSCSAARSWHPELRWVVLLAAAAAITAGADAGASCALAGDCACCRAARRADRVRRADRGDRAHRRHSVRRARPAAGCGLGGGGAVGGGGRGFGAPGGTVNQGPGATRPASAAGHGGRPAEPGGQRRRVGGLGGASTVSTALTEALQANASHYEWVAATTGDNEAASLELATGDVGDVARRLQRHRPGDHAGRRSSSSSRPARSTTTSRTRTGSSVRRARSPRRPTRSSSG